MDQITIDKAEYEQLVEDSFMLRALREGGVDNWEWFGEAVYEYDRMMAERKRNQKETGT